MTSTHARYLGNATVHTAHVNAEGRIDRMYCASPPNTGGSQRKTVERTDDPITCKNCIRDAARAASRMA